MVIVMVCILPNPSAAEDPIVIEEIEIEAKPIEEEKSVSQPSFVTVIPEEELEQGFTTVPEAIAETVGVRVNRLGGLGDFSSISIRGSTSEQVLVYMDGVLLNEAQGGGVNLGTIPASHIGEIEIYRGSAPMIFGATGIGGVIHIKTKQPGKGELLSAQVRYGSFNTLRVNGLLSQKLAHWSYLVGYDYSTSDNDFLFLDDKGTKFNASDDEVVKRNNNAFRSLNVLAKLEYDWSPKTHLNLYHNFLRTFKGIPGLGAFQSLNANFRSREYRTGLEIHHERILNKNINLNVAYKHWYKIEKFKDLEGEIGVGNQDNENKTERHEGTFSMEYLAGSHQQLKGLFNARVERFTPFDHLQEIQVATSGRRTLSVGLEDQINFWDGTLVVVPSLMYDLISNDFRGETFITGIGRDVPSPDDYRFLTKQVGAFYRFTEVFEIRGNIGHYFRPPNFFELFGDRGGVIGSVALLPEEGLNMDIGIRYTKQFGPFVKDLRLEAVYFENKIEDIIVFIQTSQRTSRPENIGRADISGVEVVASLNLGARVRFSGNYTYQRAVNRSGIPSQEGRILPGRPVHAFSGKINFLSVLGSLFYTYNFTAQNYLDPANQLPTLPRSIHGVGFSIAPTRLILISLEVKNLTDNQIEDIFGYPLPGRSYFLTAQAEF